MRRVAFASVLLVVVIAAGLLSARGAGISAARARPWPFEATAARWVWRFLVPSNIRERSNPVPETADALHDARAHWADHCAICHDNDGSGNTTVGRRVYPRPRDLRAPETQRLTDGELFYAIEQGIPWTAMPGWSTGTAEGERDTWALVRFVRHLPSITADELREMERLNPKAPPNEAREREIDDFLSDPPGHPR
jgi:mono/diheme cytochrome c family protein